MAIEPGVCASFVLELHQGIHDFTSDTFNLALYGSAATLSPDTTAYTTDGEVVGAGYTAGGLALTLEDSTPKLIGRTLVLSFADVTWAALNVTTRGALAYNATKANRAWMVINFGGDIVRAGGPLIIQLPPTDATNAIVRAMPVGS